MIIQEAIKTGKAFKRKFWRVWLFVSPSGALCKDGFSDNLTCKTYPVSPTGIYDASDLLADDWEVKP